MAQLKTRIVTRNDSLANWEANSSVVLQKGEQAYAFDTDGNVKLKIGDGIKTWAELDWQNEATEEQFFDVVKTAEDADDIAAINRVVNGASLNQGDIAVVKTLVGSVYVHTGYVYNGTTWAAMDGNYNAENVYFDEDIMITTAVGNITLTNGSANIPATGKNIKQVFEALWTKENFKPSVTNPSISLSISDNASVEGEVGTTFVVPAATVKASGFGSFQFGSKDEAGTFYPANATSDVVFSKLTVGNAATAAALTSDNSSSIENVSANSSTKSVTYNANTTGTFTDAAQSWKFSASAAHGGSARKGVSNLGNLINTSSDGQATSFATAGKGIAANAGSMTLNANKTFTATGYRAWFVGTHDTALNASEITSAFIRENLTNKGKVSTQTISLTPGADGAKCVLVAIPQGAGTLTAAVLTSSMNTGILTDYTKNKKTVNVTDASEAEGTEHAYDVYWYQPSALGSDEEHDLTITKA